MSNDASHTPRWARALAHPATLPTMILLLLAWRAWWHIVRSDLTLLEDEAHYWEWSRRLDWSYYSKGPGVAWLIGASTRLFGDTEWAVRLPAAVSCAVGMLGAAFAARWAFPDRRSLPTTSALLFAFVPGFAIASMLMTIDAPFIACWVWAGAFAVRAVRDGSRSAWLMLGLMIGVGFLFKHTMLLAVPGVVLTMLLTRGRRTTIHKPSAAGAMLLACAGLLPILIWNGRHDWATFRHLLGHLGLPGGDVAPSSEPWNPVWALEFLLVQAFVGGPVISLAFIGWLRVRRSADDAIRMAFAVLGSFAIAMYAFYLIVSLVTRTEGNWAMAGAATLCPLAAWTVLDASDQLRWLRRPLWWTALVGGVLCLLIFPGLRFASERRVIGDLIPIHRLDGMRDHAEAAARELETIRARTGREPIIVCDHYGRASQLAFHLPRDIEVFCASAPLGGRRTQYDLWTSTDLSDPGTIAPLLGRPALLFGGTAEQWGTGFEGIAEIGPLPGEPKPDRKTTFTAQRFVGFESPEQPIHAEP